MAVKKEYIRKLLKMNPENRQVKKAETIPWEAIEEKYAVLFSGKKGMPAKPLRTALGSLLIQKQLQFSDRKLVEETLYQKIHIFSIASDYPGISQTYIRPIVRGKAKAPVEFGAKLDLSIGENGIARLERLSFDAYNESDVLITAVENYKSRIGHYPERVIVDQIYRNFSHMRLLL